MDIDWTKLLELLVGLGPVFILGAAAVWLLGKLIDAWGQRGRKGP